MSPRAGIKFPGGVGHRSYDYSSPPSGNLTADVRGYQIWSTVLGAALTSLDPSGNKSTTKVYAGGAVIATQSRITTGGTAYDSIAWQTADPVTGTVGKMSYSGGSPWTDTENFEPLGQKIHPHDPADYSGPPPGAALLGNADDPEWQCTLPESYYGNFVHAPIHCGDRYYIAYETVYPDRESDPKKIAFAFPHEFLNARASAMGDRYTVATTDKTIDESSVQIADPIALKLTQKSIAVQVYAEYNPIDANNAEFGLSSALQDRLITQAVQAVRAILEKDVKDSNCSSFFGENRLAAFEALASALKKTPIGDPRNINTGIIQQDYADVFGSIYERQANGTVLAVREEKPMYRVPGKAKVNPIGPFYNPNSPQLGKYRSNTLQSRVLQILHELAHNIYGKDGKLLIENDNFPTDQEKSILTSKANTVLVQEKCAVDIDKLKE